MKNKIKIMLGIIALTLVILILFITFKFSNKRTKNIAEENSDIVESNTTNEISNIDDIKEENNIENNTIDNSTASLEDEIKENEKQVGQPKTDNKPKTTNINTNKSSSNEKKQTTKPNTPTKEETNNNEIVKPTNNKNNSNNITPTKPDKPVEKPAIKKISQEEYKAEVNRVLRDIKSIKPGLKYRNQKCSAMQIFYPYRKEEIDIAIGSVSFGTVYYYIDIFVEGNQEKFKYYIGWEGN